MIKGPPMEVLWKTAENGDNEAIVKSLVVLAALLVCTTPFSAHQVPAENLKVDVDLVLVNATVTAAAARYVTGLQKKDFHVWEDKVEQPVEYLSTEDVPVSVGIIIDVSMSMQSFGAYARQELLTFLQALKAQDEYFLMLFAGKPLVEIDLTTDTSKVEKLPFIPYECCTALYDAVYRGMAKIRKASYPKRALVVVTDGDDTQSRFTSSNLKDFAREQNVQIFSVGAEGSINNVVDVTGGYAFRGSARPFIGLHEAYQAIAVELQNEYVIGYRPTNPAKDGRWRKIQVKVDTPPVLRNVKVRAKTGYYAAVQSPVK